MTKIIRSILLKLIKDFFKNIEEQLNSGIIIYCLILNNRFNNKLLVTMYTRILTEITSFQTCEENNISVNTYLPTNRCPVGTNKIGT